MENSLLYFYSTIPQVLAAIIALVFVFVFFKLQDINKKIDNQVFVLANIFGVDKQELWNWHDLKTPIQQHSFSDSDLFKEISEIMENALIERKLQCQDYDDKQPKSIIHRVEAFEKNRRSIIRNVKFLSIYGFAVIIGSISVLYFAKSIAVNCVLSNILFVVFIVLTAIALFLVIRILYVSLKNLN